jgi:hypothetical protein
VDFLAIVDAKDDASMAKFALTINGFGNVRTETCRASRSRNLNARRSALTRRGSGFRVVLLTVCGCRSTTLDRRGTPAAAAGRGRSGRRLAARLQ